MRPDFRAQNHKIPIQKDSLEDCGDPISRNEIEVMLQKMGLYCEQRINVLVVKA